MKKILYVFDSYDQARNYFEKMAEELAPLLGSKSRAIKGNNELLICVEDVYNIRFIGGMTNSMRGHKFDTIYDCTANGIEKEYMDCVLMPMLCMSKYKEMFRKVL